MTENVDDVGEKGLQTLGGPPRQTLLNGWLNGCCNGTKQKKPVSDPLSPQLIHKRSCAQPKCPRTCKLLKERHQPSRFGNHCCQSPKPPLLSTITNKPYKAFFTNPTAHLQGNDTCSVPSPTCTSRCSPPLASHSWSPAPKMHIRPGQRYRINNWIFGRSHAPDHHQNFVDDQQHQSTATACNV